MASLKKPVAIRYRLPDGRVVPKGTVGARKTKDRSKKWYGQFTDATGRRRCLPLAVDKKVAHAMLAQLLRQVERAKAGFTDPFAEHHKRPLAEHWADFGRFLLAKGDTGDYVTKTVRRIEALMEGCRFNRIDDLTPSRVVTWLAERRDAGLGIQSSNYYLGSAKSFSRWLVRDGRTDRDRLAHLSRLNPQVDRRRRRRTLDPKEFASLMEATRSAETFSGRDWCLTGPDRAMLYLVAAYTGLRASELASLMPGSFHLAGEMPTVTVQAAYSKHRRTDVLPLRADIAEMLRVLTAVESGGGGRSNLVALGGKGSP